MSTNEPVPGGLAVLPPPSAAQLRARTVSELVDDGFAALRRYPALLAGTGALFLVPVVALVALIGEGEPTPGLVSSGSWVAGVVSVAGFSLAPALMGLPLARAVALISAGEAPSWRRCYRLPVRVWASAVMLWAALAAIRLVAFATAVLPAVAVSALFLPLSAVLAVENLGPGRSFTRALRVGSRGFGRALGVVLLQLLAGLVLTISLGLIPLIVTLSVDDRWQRPLANLFQLALGVLLCPPAAWTAAAFYVDERVRREGIDLHAQLDAWNDRPPGADRSGPLPVGRSS